MNGLENEPVGDRSNFSGIAKWARWVANSVYIIFYCRQLCATFSSGGSRLAVVSMLIGTALFSFANPGGFILGLVAALAFVSGLAGASVIPAQSLSILFSTASVSWLISRRCSSRTDRPWTISRRVDLCLSIVCIGVAASVIWVSIAEASESSLTYIFRSVEIGKEDPLFCLHVGFLWLAGIYTFRIIEAEVTKSHASRALYTIVPALTGSLIVFYISQRCTRVPELWRGSYGFLPLEDIHSFGTFAVSTFAFSWGILSSKHESKLNSVWFCCAIASSALVALSFSRATWLSFGLVLAYGLIRRLRPSRVAMLVVSALIAILVLNLFSASISKTYPQYGARLVSLVKFESVAQKDESRYFLFKRAIRMIKEKPMIGQGIGSVYRKSLNFSEKADPYYWAPEFAHNALLQFAAELGIPVTLLLCYIIIKVFFRRAPEWEKTASRRGIAFAFVALAITQMTSNSINIYLTDQLLLWILLGFFVVLGYPQEEGNFTSMTQSVNSPI